MRIFVKTKKEEFFISTADVPFSGWETMVFPAKNGEVTDWDEVYCEKYSCEEEAMRGHAKVVEFYKGGGIKKTDSRQAKSVKNKH